MAWIKFDKDLVDDPRILRAAEELCSRYMVSVENCKGAGFSSGYDIDEKDQLALMRNAVTGALLTLWVYADTHIRSGDVLPISVTAIDRMVGIDGFCDLLGKDWVRQSDDGRSVVLPGYCEKNGLISKEKRKSANAERQRRFRDSHNANSNGVSNAGRNAVSNADVTRLDQDQDQDQDQNKKKQLPASSAEALSAAGKANGNAAAYIPINDGTEFEVSTDLAAELSKLYPAVDVPQTLNEIRGWNISHPAKRKTRKGVLAHINTWMAREQNRG